MPKQPPPRNPRKNKREEILQAAMRVFCYYGFDGATLDKIAGEAGVSKALVIKYYGTQRDMILLCMHRFIDELMEKIAKNAKRKANAYETHMDYVFGLFRLSRPQIQLLLTIFLTPAHEEITQELLPKFLSLTQDTLRLFEETREIERKKELNHTMYAFLMAYVLVGHEEDFLRMRQQALAHYLA